jgi:1-deoxy-D-xylulose-5-phosphate reductoisomerase
MKSVIILGSTGSIGENALKVIKALPDRFRVVALAAATNADRIVAQAIEFGVKRIALSDGAAACAARQQAETLGIEVLEGDVGVERIAGGGDAVVVCALVGLAGLRPVVAALEAGSDVALATKEVLVAAGKIVMRRAAQKGVNILPVDSEHSALFQCLQSQDVDLTCINRNRNRTAFTAVSPVKKLVLTASGGPFASETDADFEKVSVSQALNHPRWKMGPKVTIDSATMMNKGFEIIEARWLFNLPVSQIDVVIHPESVVHSLVSFVDGSTLAQLSDPDMRLAIQYALSWPERFASDVPLVDLIARGRLSFQAPDDSRFPCLRLIRAAAAIDGTMPAVVNAADEVAVAAFLAGRISFASIWRLIEAVMSRLDSRGSCDSLESVFEADMRARETAQRLVRKFEIK